MGSPLVDTRRRAAVARAGKAHGPNLVPSDLYRIAPSEVTRLLDPVTVEATLAVDVPLTYQGSDGWFLIKNHLKSHQTQENQRAICLADTEPKLSGAELRARMVPSLSGTLVSTQFGDGFGAGGCELAHLCLEGAACMGISQSRSVLRIFIDIIRAFP